MPELPEVEAWVRELDPLVSARPIERAGPAHVATLKTADPPLAALESRQLAGARRRGKHLLFPTADGELVLRVHLMTAGRLRFLHAGAKGPKTPMFRLRFQGGDELVLTEAGKKKRAGVWLTTPEQADADLAHLGPDALDLDAQGLAEILRRDRRQLHPLLRDQRAIAGIGRAHANEILNRARLSPFKASTELADEDVEQLSAAIHEDLEHALALRERGKGDRDVYRVHDRLGEPCPQCGTPIARVDYEEHTVYYCPELPDRRTPAQGPPPLATPQVTEADSRAWRRWRPLVALETATLLAAAGNGVALVAFPWIVLELTGSAADAGLVAAVAGLPLVLSAFVSGSIVDRVGRRRTSVVSDVLSGVSVAAVPLAAQADVLTLWLLLVLAAVGAVFDPAGATAREAMLPEAAGSAGLRLERANGIHEAVFGVAFLLGPALGGLLIGLVGAEATLWATAVGFAASALAIRLVHVPGGGRPAPREDPRSLWHDGVEGLAFVWRDRTLRALTILFALLVAAWVPIEGVIMPVYFQARDAPEELGLVLMAISAGGVVGALAYGAVGHRIPRRTAFAVGLVGTALPVVGMAFLPSLWLLVVLGAATGLMFGPINPITNLALQERVPSRLRGRAIGVVTSIAYAAGPIGFLVIGPLIEIVGLRAAFLTLALILVAVAFAALFVRSLDGLDDQLVPAAT